MSPFCVLATSGSDGSVDASPRGGNPGFIHVAGPNQLLMPDRSGNNRIDSFRNIVEGSGFVQLIFFVPGIDETLRVGGKGKVSADPELLASMVEFGKPPRAVLHVDVSEAYFHCGKALMRSKLWGGDTRRARGDAQHRRSDPRPDRPRRARKPGRDLRAVQDAAVDSSSSWPGRSAKRVFALDDPGIHDFLFHCRKEDVDGRVKRGR